MKLFRQTEGMCGPTSLRILLSHYEPQKEYSEKYLARLSGATKKDGVGHAGIKNALVGLGYEIREIRGHGALLSMLLEDFPVICGIWDGDCGHYVVVKKIEHGKVYFLDPARTRQRVMSIDEFDNIWFDEESNPKWRSWLIRVRTIPKNIS